MKLNLLVVICGKSCQCAQINFSLSLILTKKMIFIIFKRVIFHAYPYHFTLYFIYSFVAHKTIKIFIFCLKMYFYVNLFYYFLYSKY